jgi:hypothetical protein
MMKVLAAEMSDPTRHRRGKQYASDGSVLDIIIDEGVVTCEIQGSRSMPYVATVEVTRGSGMPLRRDITCTCSCPDDDNWDGHACKHVVATLYTLSNEFLIEPALLDVWRRQGADDNAPSSDFADPPDFDDTPTRGTRRHLSLVRDDEHDDEPPPAPPPHVVEDSLRPVLVLQPGTELPEIPVLERADLRPPKDRDLAAVLRDAMQHMRVDWD